MTIKDIKDLEEIFKKTWCRETSYNCNKWSQENPALGQCGVSALIVQDFFGGDLLYTDKCWDKYGWIFCAHCWNRLPNGQWIDLTRCQFNEGVKIGAPKTGKREVFLQDKEVKERYVLLRSLVDKYLLKKTKRM